VCERAVNRFDGGLHIDKALSQTLGLAALVRRAQCGSQLPASRDLLLRAALSVATCSLSFAIASLSSIVGHNACSETGRAFRLRALRRARQRHRAQRINGHL